jgi:hypothetical protein
MSQSKVKTPPENTEKWGTAIMQLNTDADRLYENIRTNIRRQIPQLKAYDENPNHIAIVGGGWSLEETFDELRELYFDGVKICALNNAANWLMERNIKPSMHVLIDARPDNMYFVEEPIPHCKYFLASQCDPSLFDACEDRDLNIFHLSNGKEECPTEEGILEEHYRGRYQRVPAAGTVGNSAIMLCRLLGFRFQHLFGYDSCFSPDGRHHAYPQALNDDDPRKKIWVEGREFDCSYWHASQAINFQKLLLANGQLLELSVHGDGLIAHIVKCGASVKIEERDDAKD